MEMYNSQKFKDIIMSRPNNTQYHSIAHMKTIIIQLNNTYEHVHSK
jgi:hypothetical protein